MIKIIFAAAGIVVLLSGCVTTLKDKQPLATYDFGLPRQIDIVNTARPKVHLEIMPVVAPLWLDSSSILYRLAYQDAARLQPYANSRWAAPPAALLTLRLRQAIAAQTTANDGVEQYEVHVALEEFSQIFDTPDSSHVLLRASAKFVDADNHSPVAERTFTLEKKTQTTDAQGAVSALTQASDEFITEVVNWLAELPRN